MEKRKPYVKPVIASVNLIPDEAVLGNCKTSGVNGPSGDPPVATCAVSACSVIAS